MSANDVIQPGLDYIEQNLRTTVTAGELAGMAGYSVWYYQRLFTQATGMPFAAYFAKRRLDRALREIMGGRRAIDAALDYGFDTYAGFYKAFVRTYGSSPKSIMKNKEKTAMYTEKELRAILANWDIPQDLPILDIYIMDGTAVSGNVWSVGEEYILKTGSREKTLRNMQVMKALSMQGFASATPILTKTSAEFLDGDTISVLTRGIKGAPLGKEDRWGDERRAFGVKYGQSIARLHNALATIEPGIQPYENTYRFGQLHDKLPRQLIHRDPNPSNILFHNGEVSGFIDFDFSQRSVRLFDPCYCATGLLSEWRGVDGIYSKWFDVLDGILRGYDSVNPLTVEEKQAVYDVLYGIMMICIAYFESKGEFKELAGTNREMLRFIVDKKERIQNVWAGC